MNITSFPAPSLHCHSNHLVLSLPNMWKEVLACIRSLLGSSSSSKTHSPFSKSFLTILVDFLMLLVGQGTMQSSIAMSLFGSLIQ